MSSESDRVARAGDYVLGLMNDKERERAERDLEIDPAFRDAVVRMAERMHLFDRYGKRGLLPARHWELVAQRLAELPQMRPPGQDEAKPSAVIRKLERQPYGVGVHSLGGRRGTVIAIVLIVVFALGYLVGLWSTAGALLH
jgi:anti-sigma-K factor RskA